MARDTLPIIESRFAQTGPRDRWRAAWRRNEGCRSGLAYFEQTRGKKT